MSDFLLSKDYLLEMNWLVETVIPSLKSIDVVAREVINGHWGNGQERKNRLTQAEYDYDHVQQRVNKIE
ncbi:hypothetical protein [Granulicatella sp. zg-ZJ]|uniref:hypothetical protein n=1 Tax=Granulicatella sp. zg-ZJ TaxID=2678504 RepID=UPI001967DAB6|nr:hypothetical protein [Granulicatella sp. zg-ZJ]